MHFSDNTSSFLAHCRSAISLSKHTLRAYTADLKDAGNFFKTKAPNPAVTKDDLRHYIRYLREERALKESSIKRRLATLKLLFRWLRSETAWASQHIYHGKFTPTFPTKGCWRRYFERQEHECDN